MEEKNTYKSPVAALLWSAALPGFGQFYNGDYLLGFVLMIWEIAVNFNSNLNLAIMHGFHGDFEKAHKVIDYQWGMFYPSVYGFSLWHAYNKAITINLQLENVGIKPPKRKSYLTGFLFGMVSGMNFGLYWHFHFFRKTCCLQFLDIPVLNGLLSGLIGGILGHIIEKIHLKNKNSEY